MAKMLINRLLLATVCIATVSDASPVETNVLEGVQELKEFFQKQMSEVEEKYETELKNLKDEMSTNNMLLQQKIHEMNMKQERERLDYFNRLKGLQKEFAIRENMLVAEINDLKLRLDKECVLKNQKVNQLREASFKMEEIEGKAEEPDLKEVQKKEHLALNQALLSNMDVKPPKNSQNEHFEGAIRTHLHVNKRLSAKGFHSDIETKSSRKRQANQYGSSQVAFSARITNDSPHLSPNQDIVFDNVITNVGSAYHNTHGTFIAPVPGVYVFTTSLLAYGKTSHHAILTKNGQLLTKVDFNDADGFDQSSQMVIVELNSGDDVAVQNADYTGMVYYGGYYSTFSGFLLYEYETVPPAVGK